MPRRSDVMLGSHVAETQQDGVLDGIDQYSLPQSTVTRIAKSALPPNAKLQKESVLALVKGSTVFINYIAAAAQEVANARGHKTITAADVLQALELAEFGDMVPSLNAELAEYRARVKKNPSSAGATKKSTPPPVANAKGKGKASGAKSAAGGTSKASNGKGGDAQDAADEEEPYSEADIAAEGEDDVDIDDEVEPLDEDEEEEEEEAADQMELDEKELLTDSKALDANADDSDRD